MSVWVRVLGEPVRQFYADTGALAHIEPQQAHHALLRGVGTIRADTGGESANVAITLRNDAAQATRLFASPPLAAAVEVHDDAALIFAGIVSSVALDDACTLQVDA